MWRVGIVGCGNIAKVHADVLKNMENVNIQAFVDCKPEKAVSYKEMYGNKDTSVYTSLKEMLEKEDLDVVHICTPHYLHVPMALTALEYEKNVFMEKPPAINRKSFVQLCEAEKRAGKSVGVCFQNRYNDSVMQILKETESGKLGKVKGARAFVTWSRDFSYYKDSGWRGAKTTEGGGALINQSIHTLDLLVQFLGKPLEAESSAKNYHLKGVIDVEDTMEAYIRFENAAACFYATTAYVTDAPVLMDLEYENGRIRMEETHLSIRYKDGIEKTYDFTKKPGIGKSYWGNSHGKCIEDYYQCLQTGDVFRNSLSNVKDTFSLAMDLYESAETGKPVICGKEV